MTHLSQIQTASCYSYICSLLYVFWEDGWQYDTIHTPFLCLLVPVLPWAWALVCSDGEGGPQGTTGCWERTPAPGGGGARPKNHLAKPSIRVLQSTAGSTETQSGQGVGEQSWREGRRSRVSAGFGHHILQREDTTPRLVKCLVFKKVSLFPDWSVKPKLWTKRD